MIVSARGQRFFGLILLAGLAFGKAAGSVPGDDAFVAAQEAYRTESRAALASAVTRLKGHPLEAWARMWQLRMNLARGDDAGVRDFLQEQAGSYPAELLRADWLKLQAKQGRWEDFRRELPALAQPDAEITCATVQSRRRDAGDTGDEEVRQLWQNVSELPENCLALAQAMVSRGRLDADAIWDRVRRLMAVKKQRQARDTLSLLPAAQRPETKALDQAYNKFTRYLSKPPARFAATRKGRELMLVALQRQAHADPELAAKQWRSMETLFPAEERSYAWGQLALEAALHHRDTALAWFGTAEQLAPGRNLGDEERAWQVRAALRAHDWAAVRRGVERMPPRLAADPAWTYWLGRALVRTGKEEEGRALFRRLSGQPSFYGNLADEELGRPIALPPRAAPVTADELAAATANPGLARALALVRLGARTEGVKEWNWSLRGMDDRQLLAAAELAQRNNVIDRAISAADRTAQQHDFSLRYPAPYRDKVGEVARNLALDDGWVFGLMRQESRFVMDAHSPVGARGLMQVMPATARWVAKKIGLKNYSQGSMGDVDTNITLGTQYLKMVLDNLDRQPVLASAAYNAGPGRARRWRADGPLEGAIYAETIPIPETRDYVKKVMSNTVYYAALFEGRQQSLKGRLGTIGPKGQGNAGAEDLP